MIFYGTLVFNISGSGSLTGNELTVIIGGVQVISSVFCIIFIDYIGRRILICLSTGFMGLFAILLGWYTNIRDSNPELYEDTYGWMPPTWICLYFAAFNLGLGPISWSILGDLLPNNIKIYGAIYFTCISWFLSFIATIIFGELIISFGGVMTMCLLGGFCILSSIFFGIFMKETRGKSLIDIQKYFDINQAISLNNIN